ncbi:hypothetical protein AN641_01220 [Candidatus Epulonipiscioides gigas]|nr:hypothetical protein AN641_01220 [Epulopiscium sp. SCG-C07WGA-EpuloA2]
MIRFEAVNELTLKVINDGDRTKLFTKAGCFIGGESPKNKNYQFEKILLGPQGNIASAGIGQIMRRLTNENLPLMVVKSQGPNITYYANNQQHVVVLKLRQGERVSVESDNILAFADCSYKVRFLAQGIISQKGLVMSTLKGKGPDAQVAILTDGNPIVIDNMDSEKYLTADPDAVVAWVGADPEFKLDLSWKNMIGQASGESYMFNWRRPAAVIIQPNERSSSHK